MTGFTWDNDNDEDTPLVKRLRDEIEKRDKRLQDLDKTVNELTSKVRTQSVSDILRDLGAKPGLAKFAPSTLETSRESVEAWLKENEDLFGPVSAKVDAPSGEQTQAPPAPPQPATTGPTPEQIAALTRMQNADNTSNTLPDIEQAHIAQLTAMRDASNGNADEFLAFLRGEKKMTS